MSAVTSGRAASGADSATGRRRAIGWLGRLGALCFGLLLSLIAVEIVLRVLGPYLPIVNSLTSIATFQTYHPVYGFFHRPGASGWIETPEFTSFVSFNANGLRDRDMPVAKPPGTFRILVLGDSFVEGAQVPAEDTVSRQLMNRLRRDVPGRSIDTVNAGNAGFGTAQELLFLENDGAAYQSDVVVLVYFIDNDLPDNGYRVARDRDLDTTRRPFFVPDGHGGIELRPGLAPPPDRLAAARPWLRRLVTYNLIENFTLWHEAREQEQAQIGKNRPTYLVQPPEIWNEAWWVTEQLLASVRNTAQAQGAELVVVAAPSYYQVNADAWRSLVEADTRERNRYEQDAPNRRLAEIAQRHGLRLLDLLPSIRQAQQGGGRLYFPADGHWTSDGHQFAANQIAEYLSSSGLTPRP
jgi:lysophospholipase L1-like esterase